jgi:hypothetical protein
MKESVRQSVKELTGVKKKQSDALKLIEEVLSFINWTCDKLASCLYPGKIST